MDKWTQKSGRMVQNGLGGGKEHTSTEARPQNVQGHPQIYKSSSSCWYHILLQQIQICTDIYMFVYVHMHTVHFTHVTECAATFLSISEPLRCQFKNHLIF